MKKTFGLVCVAVLSGVLAGLVYGGVNLVLVEPYIDAAIGIENQEVFASGLGEDTPEFWDAHHAYRAWQKGGQVVAGAVLGAAMGSLFGIAFALARGSLPGRGDVGRALVLAGMMWLALFFMPFLKYPPDPPAVGDPATVELRGLLYVSFVGVSGSAAAGLYFMVAARRRRRPSSSPLVAAAVWGGGYAALMAAAFVLMPAGPDPDASAVIPADLLGGFRTASALASVSFWASVAVILGVLWRRFVADGPTAASNAGS